RGPRHPGSGAAPARTYARPAGARVHLGVLARPQLNAPIFDAEYDLLDHPERRDGAFRHAVERDRRFREDPGWALFRALVRGSVQWHARHAAAQHADDA